MAKTVNQDPPSTALVAGKYQLIKMIGRGGMGSVWEGRHTTLGTRVAIKFIEAEYAGSEEAVSRFDNEAKAAAKIDSKHAIKIYDHGVTEDGKPYIVMEMLTGEPLDKRIERLGRIPLQDVARIFQQVCRGLGRAHEHGIIHRDLKPENIFLCTTPDEDEEYAKVLDFGIAKIKGSAGQQLSNSTKTGAVLGTPYFMSPEQARGLRDIDHRTDLWSLGVIVFKCVTGVLPFDGESLGDLLVKICTTQIPIPSQVLPGLPPAFDAWFARSLEREPQKRFATAHEMSDALSYACGVSVRRPANHQGYAPPQIGNAATAMATPNPLAQSPFPHQTGPNQTPGGAYGAAPHPSNPPPNAGSASGNYGAIPTPYGGLQQRPSHPGTTPAPAAFATQGPLTASSPQMKPASGVGGILLGVFGTAAVALAIVLFVVLRGGSSSSSGHANASQPQKVAEPALTASAEPTTTVAIVTSASAAPSASSLPPELATAASAEKVKPQGGSTKAAHGGSHATNDKPPAQTHGGSSGPGTGGATKPPSGGSVDQSGF